MTKQVKDAAGQVRQQAGQVTEQVKEQASQVTDKAKDQAASRADEQKQRAADNIVGFANALNQVSSSMRDQNPTVANFADTAATRLESFATSLNNKDINELMNDVEDLARRQPALFIGGAFLAGVFAARFLKSSSGMSTGGYQGGYRNYGYRDYEMRGSSSPYGRPTTGTSYSSPYGSTSGRPGRGSQRSESTSRDQSGLVTSGQDTPGAIRTGTGDVDTSGRGIGTTSSQTSSPRMTGETTNPPGTRDTSAQTAGRAPETQSPTSERPGRSSTS